MDEHLRPWLRNGFRGPGWSHADLHALSQNEFYGVAIFLFSFLF